MHAGEELDELSCTVVHHANGTPGGGGGGGEVSLAAVTLLGIRRIHQREMEGKVEREK